MRVYYIDALKGLACIIVFIFHFNAAFIVDSVVPQRIPSPIGFIVDGSWAVYLFLLLSGFSISMSLQKKQQYQDHILKRYFRLALPVSLIQIIAYIMGLFGLYTNGVVSELTNNSWIGHFYTDFSIITLLKGLIFAVPWGDGYTTPLIAPVWMLTYVFWGTFLVVCLQIASNNLKNKKIAILYLLFIIICLSKYSSYYISVILGALLARFYDAIISKNGQIKIYVLSVICFVAGLICYAMHFHPSLSTGLMVLFFILNPWIQNVMSKKIVLFLGDISLWVYLIHWPIICSIGGSIFVKNYNSSPESSYYISLLVCLFVTIILSYVFTIYFNPLFEKIIKKFVLYIKS